MTSGTSTYANVKASTEIPYDDRPDTFVMKMSKSMTRVAVVGNVDAGKSTLIGVLTSGILDDGRGQSRASIMKHQHEIDSGRTSAIGTHLIGFDEDNSSIIKASRSVEGNADTVNVKHQLRKKLSEDAIALRSHHLVSLVDLAGHEKYLKTTISGVSGGMIDYALVLVNSNHPPTHMTMEHISLCSAMGIPIIIVLTKIDSCPKHALKKTKEDISNILRSPGIQKKPFSIKKDEDIVMVVDKMHAIVPTVNVSCVSGEGMDLLQNLIGSLPKRRRHHNKVDRPFECLIEEVFKITGVGIVTSGIVNAGSINVDDTIYIGPLQSGDFLQTTVKSIEISRVNVRNAIAGNSACLALSLSKEQRRMIRKGMVALTEPMKSTDTIEAEMVVLKGNGVDGTTIREGYQTMLNILHIKQTAYVEAIEMVNDATLSPFDLNEQQDGSVVVRPGCRARFKFRFMHRNEYVRKGMRVLFRDGRLRGCGIVTKVE